MFDSHVDGQSTSHVSNIENAVSTLLYDGNLWRVSSAQRPLPAMYRPAPYAQTRGPCGPGDRTGTLAFRNADASLVGDDDDDNDAI